MDSNPPDGGAQSDGSGKKNKRKNRKDSYSNQPDHKLDKTDERRKDYQETSLKKQQSSRSETDDPKRRSHQDTSQKQHKGKPENIVETKRERHDTSSKQQHLSRSETIDLPKKKERHDTSSKQQHLSRSETIDLPKRKDRQDSSHRDQQQGTLANPDNQKKRDRQDTFNKEQKQSKAENIDKQKKKNSGNDFSQTSQDMKQQKGQQQQPMDGISTKVPESSHKQQKNIDLPQLSQSMAQLKQHEEQLKGSKSIKNPESSQTHSKPKDRQAVSLKPDVPAISDKHSQQIDRQIEMLRKKLFIPKRKNKKAGGTLGRHTMVDVNHLPLLLEDLFKKTVYHIDAQFKPDLPKRLLRSALEEFVTKFYNSLNFAFDGSRNMYTTKEIKPKTDMVTVINEENGKPVDFCIAISIVNVIQMSKIQDYLKDGSSNSPPGEAFQALDIVLKNRPFALRFTNVGRSFFPIPRIIPVDLGDGMELWKGFFQSPVMGWKPYLNIDVAHKGFPKFQSLTTYITNELNSDLHNELDHKANQCLAAYVKGLKVDVTLPNVPNLRRSYKVVGLLDTAAKFFFEIEEPCFEGSAKRRSKLITVIQYYKITRNYVVKYPNLPCLHVGNVNKKTAIPIELCTVQRGQLRLKKLTERQTGQMVRNAARPPNERQKAIENCIHDIKYNGDKVLKEFGINIQEQFASIKARILDQPYLSYAQNQETQPSYGVWRPNKFAKAVTLKKWVILNLDFRVNMSSIKNFEKLLIQSGKDLNVAVEPMFFPYNLHIQKYDRIESIEESLNNFLMSQKVLNPPVELVVVIIPDYPQGIYASVKQLAELQIGILTQCIKSKTMSRINNSTTSNILLKINSKLNGVNHTLAKRISPSCMNGAIIFGADVTHPSPDQTSIPSVAAVAASHDQYGSQYNMEWRLQSPKVEIIQDLEDIIHKQLLKFKEKTNSVPKKLFYFRDGVSEGQFLQLLDSELIAIRRACLRLNINYKPSITFVVVQKRHHTRMFPKNHIDMDGKFNNVPSGTVIDTQITHPTELDFYLCSHASIQGTSRPTKYHLLWDDNDFSEDELEKVTFYLCFMFVRCTRSVSYPAPTYYAHLAAFRARAYIEHKRIDLEHLEDEQARNKMNLEFIHQLPMYFV